MGIGAKIIGVQVHAGWRYTQPCRLVHDRLDCRRFGILVSKLKDVGVRFRNEIVDGPGGKQILCKDPSGNVVELFQPA